MRWLTVRTWPARRRPGVWRTGAWTRSAWRSASAMRWCTASQVARPFGSMHPGLALVAGLGTALGVGVAGFLKAEGHPNDGSHPSIGTSPAQPSHTGSVVSAYEWRKRLSPSGLRRRPPGRTTGIGERLPATGRVSLCGRQVQRSRAVWLGPVSAMLRTRSQANARSAVGESSPTERQAAIWPWEAHIVESAEIAPISGAPEDADSAGIESRSALRR